MRASEVDDARDSARVEGGRCDRATRASEREVERASRREDAASNARRTRADDAHTQLLEQNALARESERSA